MAWSSWIDFSKVLVNSFGTSNRSHFYLYPSYRHNRSGNTVKYEIRLTVKFENDDKGSGSYNYPIGTQFNFNNQGVTGYVQVNSGTSWSNGATVGSHTYSYSITNTTGTGTVHCYVYANNMSTYGMDHPGPHDIYLTIPPMESYTVTYNLNGGTSGLPSNQMKIHGQTLVLSKDTPIRDSTTSNGYVITFNGNGGTPSKTSATATDTTNYTFKNWNDVAAGTGTSYEPGGNYTANAAVTLYAQWTSALVHGPITAATATKANTTSSRIVNFDATTNGGSCSTSNLTSTATVTHPCSGWFASGIGGTKRCDSGATYTPTATETWYAQYTDNVGTFSEITLPAATKASKTHSRTVNFNATSNGGICNTSSLTSNATETFTQSGWFKGTTSVGNAGVKYRPAGTPETLVAQFTSQIGSYSAVTLPEATKASSTGSKRVNFNPGEGTCATQYLDSTYPITYTLSGWFTATTGGTSEGTSGDTYTPSSSSETLYAQFTSKNGADSGVVLPAATKASTALTRTVNFDANGGTCQTKSLTSTATVTYTQTDWMKGSALVGKAGARYYPTEATETLTTGYTSQTGSYSSITLPTPTKNGYIFKGWAENSEAESGITGSYTPTTDGVTLYAIWESGQATVLIKRDQEWKNGKVWFNKDNTWVQAKQIYVKKDGAWIFKK